MGDTLRRIWDVLRGDVYQVRSTIAEADPDAEVFMMRGNPTSAAGALALGASSLFGPVYQLVMRRDGMELWATGDGPALELPYSRIESASPTVTTTFVPEHGIELLVMTEGPAVSLPLIPFDRGDPQGQDAAEELTASLRARAPLGWIDGT